MQMQRNFDAANKTIDRALQLNPNGIGLWEIKVKLAIAEKGDFSVYEQALEKVKSLPMSSEERLKIVGAQARSSPVSTQVPAGIATGPEFP